MRRSETRQIKMPGYRKVHWERSQELKSGLTSLNIEYSLRVDKIKTCEIGYINSLLRSGHFNVKLVQYWIFGKYFKEKSIIL